MNWDIRIVYILVVKMLLTFCYAGDEKGTYYSEAYKWSYYFETGAFSDPPIDTTEKLHMNLDDRFGQIIQFYTHNASAVAAASMVLSNIDEEWSRIIYLRGILLVAKDEPELLKKKIFIPKQFLSKEEKTNNIQKITLMEMLERINEDKFERVDKDLVNSEAKK